MMLGSVLFADLLTELRAEARPAAKRAAAIVPAKSRLEIEHRGDCAVIRIGNGGRKAWCKAKGAGIRKVSL